MFGDSRPPDSATKPLRPSAWVKYTENLLAEAAVFNEFTMAAVLAAIGLLLLALSLRGSQQMSITVRGIALGDLAVSAIVALLGLWERWQRQRSAP